jgi:hypothetical protein
MLSWISPQHDKLEAVRVVRTDRGLRANGYMIQSGSSTFGSSYSVLADATGRTRRLTVQTDTLEGERHLALTRTPGGPWVVESTAGSHPLFALDGAEDLDIESSAFTKGLTLRRLAGSNFSGHSRQLHHTHRVKVGCISIPALEVRAIEAEYTFGDHSNAWHRGPSGDADLILDDDNFVVTFPGMWNRTE